MALILLRHASPPVHCQNRYWGHTDISIDPDLFDQAKLDSLRYERFDRVYTSDLLRCTETLEAMGHTDFIREPRLREVRFKPEIEGKTFAEIERMEEFSPAYLESSHTWHQFICDEPEKAFHKRIQSFFDELDPNKHLLICSHAGTINAILSLLQPDQPPAAPGYLDYVRVSLFGYNLEK